MTDFPDRINRPVVRFIPSGSLMALCPRVDGAVEARIYADPCSLASSRRPVAGFEIGDEPLPDVRSALKHFFFEAPFAVSPKRRSLARGGFTAAAAKAMDELQNDGAVFLRGDPEAFLVAYRALPDGFSLACIASEPCSLTFRAVDAIDRMGRSDWLGARFNLTIVRDANRRDGETAEPEIKEEFGGLNAEVRVFLDFKRNGGAVMRFKLDNGFFGAA